MRRKHLTIAALALALTIVAGFGYGKIIRIQGGGTGQNGQEDRVVNQGDNAVDTTNWKTYSNVASGISFKYPPCLAIRKDEPGIIELVSSELRRKENKTIYRSAIPELSINYSPIDTTFAQWKEENLQGRMIEEESLMEGEDFKKWYGAEGLTFLEGGLLITNYAYLFRKDSLGIEVDFFEGSAVPCLNDDQYDTIIKSFLE